MNVTTVTKHFNLTHRDYSCLGDILDYRLGQLGQILVITVRHASQSSPSTVVEDAPSVNQSTSAEQQHEILHFFKTVNFATIQ